MATKDIDDVLILYVETLAGTVFELEASSQDTVMSVKTKLQVLEGIPTSQQHLIWRSKELDDDYTLQDYRITDGSTLKLVISMRGGPINTRRIPVEDPTWKEMTEYMEANRDELWDKLPGGRQVTLLVFRDGDQINFFRLLDRGDGTVAPVTETISSSPIRSVCITEDLESVDQRLRENNVTMHKMRSIRRQMEALTLKKKIPRKKITSIRQSTSMPLSSVLSSSSSLLANKPKSQRTSHRHQLRLPPIPGAHNVIGTKSINLPSHGTAASETDSPIMGISLVPRLVSQSREHDLRRRHPTGGGGSSDLDSPTSPPLVQLTVGDGGVLRVETSCSSDSDDLEPRRRNQSTWSTSMVDSCENLNRADSRSRSTAIRDGTVAMGILSPASEIPTPRRHQLRGLTQQATGSTIDNLEKLQQTLAKFDPRISVQTRMPRTTTNRSNIDGGMGFLVRRMTMDKEVASSGDGMRPKTSPSAPPLTLARTTCTNQRPARNLLSLLTTPTDNAASGSQFNGTTKKTFANNVAVNSETNFSKLTVLPLEETSVSISTGVDAVMANTRKSHHRRCLVCKRKTGLATSYSCRCGGNFCANHRYAETHNCNYDYKTEGRRLLEQTNPLVTAQKLPEI